MTGGKASSAAAVPDVRINSGRMSAGKSALTASHRAATSAAAALHGVATTAKPKPLSASRKEPYSCLGAAPAKAPPTKWKMARGSPDSGSSTSQPRTDSHRPPDGSGSVCDDVAASPHPPAPDALSAQPPVATQTA
eukprot:scaffold910_cov115-Isochrysis_galbana.AAC.7